MIEPPDGQSLQQKSTNGWAIAAFVLALLGGILLSVIFAIVALTQIRRRGQRGYDLAIAALALSAVWVALLVAVLGYAATHTR